MSSATTNASVTPNAKRNTVWLWGVSMASVEVTQPGDDAKPQAADRIQQPRVRIGEDQHVCLCAVTQRQIAERVAGLFLQRDAYRKALRIAQPTLLRLDVGQGSGGRFAVAVGHAPADAVDLAFEHGAGQQVEGHAHRVAGRDFTQLVLA